MCAIHSCKFGNCIFNEYRYRAESCGEDSRPITDPPPMRGVSTGGGQGSQTQAADSGGESGHDTSAGHSIYDGDELDGETTDYVDW